MKTTTIAACFTIVLSMTGAEPRILWEFNPRNGFPEGAETIRENGNKPILRVKGPAEPFVKIDGALLRGKMVTVEGSVRGEKIGTEFGDSLKLVPDYLPSDQFRENWAMRPPPNIPQIKTDWVRCHGSWRIPEWAGDFKLVFGHAGKNGIADYRDVRILEVPAPETFAQPKHKKRKPRTQYRGAMFGNVKNEEAFRIFSQEWNGNLIRWQFLEGGPAVFKTPDDYLNWGRARIAELKKVLPYCRKYDLKVVIDLHRGPGKMNFILNNLGLWEPEQQNTILQLWKEIATEFKADPVLYGYDLVNEPVDKVYDVRGKALDWNRFAELLAVEIRKIDPVTPIIVEPTTMQFSGFKPLNLPNIIYSPHIYEPGEYTHQGIRTRKMEGPYPDSARGWNKEMLRRLAQPIIDFQKKYGVPIFVGEFGVIRWAPGGARWLDDWISIFEENGWDWTFHAFREWDGWSVEHSPDKKVSARVGNTDRKNVILNYLKRNRKNVEILWSLERDGAKAFALEKGVSPSGTGWKVSGTAPSLRIDSSRFRGKLVTVEAMVKIEGTPRKEAIRLVPDYSVLHDEIYPPETVSLQPGKWCRYTASLRVPEFAGAFRLIFDFSGENETAFYREVRLITSSDRVTPRKVVPAVFQTKSRGAMFGNVASEEGFRTFGADWNGNLIRWQFAGSGKSFSTETEYLDWGRREMKKMDAILPYCRKYGIKVVIDLHRAPGLTDRLRRNFGIWTPSLQNLIVKLWKEITAHYKGNPLIYGYDLLNEPVERGFDPRSGGLDWNRFADRLAKEIRKIDPETPIIVTFPCAGKPFAASGFLPIDAPNIIYTCHVYNPGAYTHSEVFQRPKSTISWPDVANGWDRNYLEKILKPVRDFQEKYQVPVYVGEFGVAAWAPGAENWMRDCVELFESYGWDWTFHAFREWEGWSVEHSGVRGALKKDDNTPRRQIILNYLKRNQKKSISGKGV